MRRAVGGVVAAPVLGVLLGACFTAAASVILVHLVSPIAVAVAVAGLLSVAIGFRVMRRYAFGGLVLLLLCLPLGRLTVAEVVSPVTVMAMVMFAVWAWRALTRSERIASSYLHLPLGIFLLCGVVGILGAQDVVSALKILSVFGLGTCAYLVAFQTIRSIEDAQAVLWAAAISVASIGVFAAVAGMNETIPGDHYYGGGGSYNRIAGIFGSPNHLGGFFALAIPPIVALAATESVWWRRLAGYGAALAAMLGLAFTYSRGAWLAAGVGLLVILVVLRRGIWLAVVGEIGRAHV